MALLLNNQISSGSSPSTNSGTIGQGLASVGQGLAAFGTNAAQGLQKAVLPTTASNFQNTPTQTSVPQIQAQPITGLLSPSHPAVGTLPASSGIASHTVTTNPDNSVTSKVTYPTTPATETSSGTALPPAPVAPIAQASIPQDPASNPTYNSNTGSTAQTPTQGNPYVASLANTATAGSANATNATSGLLSAPSQNAAIAQQVQGISNEYGDSISRISNYGNALAGSYLNGPGLAPVSQGLAGAAQNTTANEVQGQLAAENAALNPINQELTAQNQAQSGLEGAGGIANTQQANTQSGLNQAGALAQPTPTTAGQPVFNPATGQYTAGGGASTASPTSAPAGYSQADWNTIVQNVANGVPGAISGLPTVLQAQAQAAAQAQNPNFNINTALGQATGAQATAAAPGQAAATNISTSGTAATTGTAAALQGTIGTYNTMSAYNTTANQQAQTVQQVLQSTGLNQGVPAFTKPLNSLAGQLGSANVTALTSAVTEMQNAYSQLLNSGGTTPTGSEAQALALLSPNSTPEQINSVISQLQTAAYNKLSGQYSQLQTENSALQSSNSNSNASNSPSNPSGWF